MLLATEADEIARRMRARAGHHMPASLLGSQLATLERPGADECAITLDAAPPIAALTAAALGWINCR